jgi:carboxypeptidase PM20D1
MKITRILFRLGLLAAVASIVLVAVLLVRALTVESQQPPIEPYEPLTFDVDAAVQHFSESLRIRSISSAVPALFDRRKIIEFHEFLERTYPRIHATLNKELVSGHTLLYRWDGTDPNLRPMLLMAHMDVVPVDDFRAQDWTHDPFGGVVADGFVWGRGALDDKGSLIAIMEAVEALITSGFTPNRTLYLSLGHDEEIGGPDGAKKVAELFVDRGIRPEFSVDEGMGLMVGVVPGMSKPLAIVALAEKGYVTLELSAEARGGHSSNPPQHSAIGILSKAITRLEENQMPASLEGPFRYMFQHAASEMDFPFRVVMANLWLTEPLLVWLLLQDSDTAAAIRTTTAVTMIESGIAENVLPMRAVATVNHRLMPRDSVEDLLAHVERVIADERVTVTPLRTTSPSGVSDPESPSYDIVARSIRQVFTDAAVAPGMDLGGSDSKHFYGVVDQIYRIWPYYMEDADNKRLHGIDERLSVENFIQAIHFYVQLIRNAQ